MILLLFVIKKNDWYLDIDHGSFGSFGLRTIVYVYCVHRRLFSIVQID